MPARFVIPLVLISEVTWFRAIFIFMNNVYIILYIRAHARATCYRNATRVSVVNDHWKEQEDIGRCQSNKVVSNLLQKYELFLVTLIWADWAVIL